MKPSQVASYLRKIATAIEKSRKPNPNLVAQDLKGIILALTKTAALTVTPVKHPMGPVFKVQGVTSSGAQINARIFTGYEPEDIEWLDPVPPEAEPGVGVDWDEIVVLL